MKKRLIILNTSQFGMLTDSYKWCQYLKDNVDITFICFDNHVPRKDLEGVSYKYVHRFNNPILRGIWYIIYSLIYCAFHLEPVFIVYFDYCQIFPMLLGKRRFHVDVRTLAVSDNESHNAKQDLKLCRSLSYFDSVSYISEGVKRALPVNAEHQYILPLGADIISNVDKKWDSIRLLYVGTMNHRDIPKTIDGLYSFTEKYGKGKIHYDIVGDGQELQIVKQKIIDYGLSDVVSVHGKVEYDNLKCFFNNCNVGVSFIPIKNCYQHQPPTKSFEYILSGLYCIATSTAANIEIINASNGILIEDTAVAFENALYQVLGKIDVINSVDIRNSLSHDCQWQSIVRQFLLPIVEQLSVEKR